MNKSYKTAHREEIKRRMHRYKNRNIISVFSLFIIFLVMLFSNINAIINNKQHAVTIFIIIIITLFFYASYLIALRSSKKNGWCREWLTPLNQLYISLLIGVIFLTPNKNEWTIFIGMFLVIIYAAWKIRHNSKPYWKIYFFKSGRSYLNEVKQCQSSTKYSK